MTTIRKSDTTDFTFGSVRTEITKKLIGQMECLPLAHLSLYYYLESGKTLEKRLSLFSERDRFAHSAARTEIVAQFVKGANRASQSRIASWVNVNPRARNISATFRRLSL
jgi:hypothetical protein